MSKVSGTYRLLRNENLAEHLIALRNPPQKAKMVDVLKPILTVDKEGKRIKMSTDLNLIRPAEYILDEEVEEVMPIGHPLRTSAKLEGNTLTLTSITRSGHSGVRIFEFSDTALIEKMIIPKVAVPSTRFYVRI